MSYLRIKDVSGRPLRGPHGRFVADAPYIWVSKYGSPYSNSKTQDPRANWGNRYSMANSRRQSRLCRGG